MPQLGIDHVRWRRQSVVVRFRPPPARRRWWIQTDFTSRQNSIIPTIQRCWRSHHDVEAYKHWFFGGWKINDYKGKKQHCDNVIRRRAKGFRLEIFTRKYIELWHFYHFISWSLFRTLWKSSKLTEPIVISVLLFCYNNNSRKFRQISCPITTVVGAKLAIIDVYHLFFESIQQFNQRLFEPAPSRAVVFYEMFTSWTFSSRISSLSIQQVCLTCFTFFPFSLVFRIPKIIWHSNCSN